MKMIFILSGAFVMGILHPGVLQAEEDEGGVYQCPSGWNTVARGSILCQNPRNGSVLMRLDSGEVINVREGKRDRYCPSGWAVLGIFVSCR